MEIGLYANTHGYGYRDEVSVFLSHVPPDEMQPVLAAQTAEKAGFHSLWFPDHVSMPGASDSHHTANISGVRAYQARHNMMDAAVTMGAVAISTSRIKLGTSCLIAPYRHPLSDARQFATVDQLSRGRLMLGVASGWMAEEFESVGFDYADRNKMVEECIETYKRCWTEEIVGFQGEFYRYANLSMDPKPFQKPRPKIYFGGATPAGVRRATRLCDGLYPLFLDPHAEPARYASLQDEIRRESERLGRDASRFSMLCATTGRLTEPSHKLAEAKPRRICTGTPDQVLGDLERFAKAGYSLVVIMIADCAEGRFNAFKEQLDWFGREVIPAAKSIKPAGEWLPVS